MPENYDHPCPPPVRAAQETARHIEDAAASGNTAAYDTAMNEVNQYRLSHSSRASSMYMNAVTEKLQDDHTLPQVALFDVKAHFGDIDKNGDGLLQAGEIGRYRGRSDANAVQQSLAQYVSENYDEVKRFDWLGGLAQNITHHSLDWELSRANGTSAVAHLFEKNDKGVCLYDRLKDKAGNIPHGTLSHFQSLDETNHNTLGLSEQDKKSIEYLRSFWGRSMKSYLPFTDDASREDLQELCRKHNLEAL